MVCALTAQCAYDAVVAAESAPSKELCELAASLHDVLLSLEGEGELQEAIASLCEAWWANETPNREALAPQCVPYVLAKALDSGRLADVKRCYAMRDALALFDYDDESIGSLKLLLLRCTFAPAFLRAPDGRRFLAGLFCLSSSMVPDLMAIVRNQIPSGRKSLLDAYSDVLLKAWKGAAGQALYAVEYSCVQELMRACLHARTPALATSVRRVLAAFYTKKAKAGREVEGMAVRLWEPILFKALSAANTAVRRNAVHALAEAFPLQDPAAKHQDSEALLQRQFTALSEALKDECPSVRVAAVEGTCRILDTYWELMPPATAGALLATLVDELARDASAAAVRAAVAEGLAFLVEQPLAQPVLKKALPRCAHLLTDSNARTRKAFASVLRAVRGVRAIKLTDVVPSDKLLVRMARETDRNAAGALAELLVPSFLPPGKPPAEAAQRLLDLLEQNPAALAPFCKWAPAKGASPEAVGEALALLSDLLAEGPADEGEGEDATAPQHAKRAKKKGGKGKGGRKAAKEPEAADGERRLPYALYAPAMQALASLATSARRNCSEALERLDGAMLARAMPHAMDAASRAALLRAAASLPAAAAEAELTSACGRLLRTPAPLRSTASDAAWRSEAMAILELTCAWGGVGALAGALAETLKSASAKRQAIGGAEAGTTKRGKKKGAPSDAANEDEDGELLTAGDAARYAEMLLQQEATRADLLDDHDAALDLRSALHGAAVAALTQGEAAADLVMVAGKAAVHLAIVEVWDASEASTALLELCSKTHDALAAATEADEGMRGAGARDAALEVAAALLAVCGDAAMMGLVGSPDLDNSLEVDEAVRKMGAAVREMVGDANPGQGDWRGELATLCAGHATRATFPEDACKRAADLKAGAAAATAAQAAPTTYGAFAPLDA